ncbi:MAG: hypothetical protein OHK0022_03650 [Roseiflexaceae bacterium]
MNDNNELDLNDLEVERFDVAKGEDGVEGLTFSSLGHGITEIGASCCTSGQQQNGSCTIGDIQA